MTSNQLPDSSNFFATIFTEKSKAEIAQLYKSAGWKLRKCTFTDFEISQDWASIVIDGNDNILMHGVVADVEERVAKLMTPLQQHAIAYCAEFYDVDENLEATFTFPS